VLQRAHLAAYTATHLHLLIVDVSPLRKHKTQTKSNKNSEFEKMRACPGILGFALPLRVLFAPHARVLRKGGNDVSSCSKNYRSIFNNFMPFKATLSRRCPIPATQMLSIFPRSLDYLSD
jgi:hypothetical protein